MQYAATIDPVGHYCGRFDASWSGEILNSASNISFVIAAALGLMMWCAASRRELSVLGLILSALGIAGASFVFHSHPTPSTRLVDLAMIHVFAIGYIVFAARRWVGLGWFATAAWLSAFAACARAWERVVHGALGGTASHVPVLVALAMLAVWLVRQAGAYEIGRRLVVASVWYIAALAVRAIDVPICAALPIGVHWIWHVLQGATIGHLLAAACETSVARYVPDRTAGIASPTTA